MAGTESPNASNCGPWEDLLWGAHIGELPKADHGQAVGVVGHILHGVAHQNDGGMLGFAVGFNVL